MGKLDFDKELVANLSYLKKFAFKLERDETKADDLVQETLEAALVGKESFRGECTFRSWLTQIMKNRAYTNFRREARIEYGTETYENALKCLHEDANQFERMVLEETCGCIAKLSPAHQEVLVGMRVFGRTIKELAKAARIPENTVKTRMHYADKDFHRHYSEQPVL